MSEQRYEYKKSLLDHLYGQIALIEPEYFEYLNSETQQWEKMDFGELDKVPVFLYHNYRENPETHEESYDLVYELMIPHVKVVPSHTESFTFGVDFSKDDPYYLNYTSIPNPDYDESRALVRYNNDGLYTLSKLHYEFTVYKYLRSNRSKLHEAARKIYPHIDVDFGRQLSLKNTSH